MTCQLTIPEADIGQKLSDSLPRASAKHTKARSARNSIGRTEASIPSTLGYPHSLNLCIRLALRPCAGKGLLGKVRKGLRMSG